MQPLMREMTAPMQDPATPVGGLRCAGTVDHLAARDGVGDRLGVLGFCFGGSYSFALAAADPRIQVAMPFYGSPPEQADACPTIGGPVLAFYGETDERLIQGCRPCANRWPRPGVDFTAQVYPGVGHAFFNDTNPHTYDAETAADAWARTLAAAGTDLRRLSPTLPVISHVPSSRRRIARLGRRRRLGGPT